MTTTAQFTTARRIFTARIIEGDAPAAEHMALTIAAMLEMDYTEASVARPVPAIELDQQIACAGRILRNRIAEGDTGAAEWTAETLALLMAKRAQRAAV